MKLKPYSTTKQSSQGFTIIEVMIVLVIAAVILLIVFLAVPALQRNSRNTQRRADISRLNAAFLEYIQANSIPTGNAGSNTALAAQMKTEANVTSFSSVQITNAVNERGPANDNTRDLAQFRTRSKCNEAGTNVEQGASSGRVAIIYYIETSGDPQLICTQIR